jgi:hypothetical protein
MGGNNIDLVEIKVVVWIHTMHLLFCLLFIGFMDFENLWLFEGDMAYEQELWLVREVRPQGFNFKQLKLHNFKNLQGKDLVTILIQL